jgi:serine O-acetyltransferase
LSLIHSIRRDIKAALDRDPAASSAVSVVLTYPGFHARQLHRLAHTLRNVGVPFLPGLVAYFNRFLTGIEIHPGARIGEGLFIDHGMGVVIGETTVIGDDCHLTQGVTLGGTSTRHEKRHPTLENRVYVGVGAKIIGAVNIGEHATIGAGSVVVSSVPAYATVVGVPGKVIAYYDPGNETKIRLPDPEWDRMEELEQRLETLKGQVEALEAELAEHGRAAAASAHRRTDN